MPMKMWPRDPQLASSISEDIEGVNTTTIHIKENSDQVMGSADGLNQMANDLKQIVQTFKIE